MVHYSTMLGDYGALTAGAVASSPPDMRGAKMAVYSFLSFSTAFLAGGNQSVTAWGLAFVSFDVLLPLARWWYRRRT